MKFGFDFPTTLRKTYLYDLEENWYNPLISELFGISISPTKRSNFGEYDMAVNYLTSVLEEAKAINKVAVYNIDHMAQLKFWGKDVVRLLNRALAGNVSDMKVGSCKYTLLLNENGGVQDDLIVMRLAETEFILVINAGHDITGLAVSHGSEIELIADIDRIMRVKTVDEEVFARDISDKYVKLDVQGPLSYKLIKSIYGEEVLKSRSNPDKNMNFFSFNEFVRNAEQYYISRTGYTNRWGWELYIPVKHAIDDSKKIITMALELGGLLVGLGGRDENRISAGAYGLPLMGQEYDPRHAPTNAPLFDAAVDMSKEYFVGKSALESDLKNKPTKKMVILVSEGIASGRSVYLDKIRLGSVTSSINSPNISLEMRLALNSKRKNVNDENGTAAIGLAWLYRNPFVCNESGNEITDIDGNPVRIFVELYKEDTDGKPVGQPIIGYITAEGINPATAPKPLKLIETM